MVTTRYGRVLAALLTAVAVLAGLSVPTAAVADDPLGTPPTTSAADWAPVGVEADKGAPPVIAGRSVVRSKASLAATAAATKCGKPCYFYNTGRQEVTNTGAWATAWIDKPELGADDYHSLAELSVQSSLNGIRQIVEVGWTVDLDVNKGDDNPHLFVYNWINNVGGCFNGCGFVVAADAKVLPGALLTPGTAKRFGIQNIGGNWWVNYDNNWFGYFPGKLWSEQGVDFSTAGVYQTFGEVASTIDQPCADMGNGVPGKSASTVARRPAYFSGANYFDETGVSTTADLFITTDPVVDNYSVGPVSGRAFYYGGAGFGPC